MTWDGVACWTGGTPGKTTKQDCPAYYENPRVSWRSRRYNLSNLSPTCDGFMFVTKLIKTKKKLLTVDLSGFFKKHIAKAKVSTAFEP